MFKNSTLTNVSGVVEQLERSHVAERGLRGMLRKLVKRLGKIFVINVFNMHIFGDQAIPLLGRYQEEICVCISI